MGPLSPPVVPVHARGWRTTRNGYGVVMRVRLLMAVMAVSLLLIAPADAQTDLDRARSDVGAVTERLEQYLADLEATQQRGDDLAAQYWQVQSGLEKLDLDLAAGERAATELAQRREFLRDEVRVVALDQYVSRSENIGGGDHVSHADRAAAEALARLVVGADNNAIDQLAALDAEQASAQELLEQQRVRKTKALTDVEATQTSLFEELDRLTQLRELLDTELGDLESTLASLEQAEAERQAAAAERVRIAEERERAQQVAAAAAELARQVRTPAPVPSTTAVPNPQLPDASVTAVPNPQLPDAAVTVVATAVPNPQLPDASVTAVPNPQPSTPVAPVGGILCPLNGAFTHTDDFNSPRAVGGIHRANDLISAQGTPVIAVAAGTVEHRDSSVGGMSVHLKGDNGDYYFYTHLSGYENQGAGHVGAGTVVGYVGMTGNAPIPHLHFEIHSGGYGNYTNPYSPVRSACF